MPLVIDGLTIGDDVIDQEFSAIKAHYESLGSISCCERDGEFRGYARDNITFRALLTQEAQRTISEPAAEEVTRAFDKLKEEHGGGDRFYADSGLTPEQDEFIRRDLSLNLQVETLRAETCKALPAPTETECRQFYDSSLDQFSDEDEVCASHIFKSVREVEKREEIFKALCEVRQRLVDGADFTELAREHSDKPAEEIDLGAYLVLGKGEEKTAGRLKDSLLANSFEAVIAAVYLDGGLQAATEFVDSTVYGYLTGAIEDNVRFNDFKSVLQERLQSVGRPLPEGRGRAAPPAA